MRALRTKMQLIFQDPYSSLPPRMTIGNIISEAVKVHNIVPKEEVTEYVMEIMKKCGLQPGHFDRYPHEFSGGQRQRICIARALVVNPKLVICDEPVSALDVSIQAQVINLLNDLSEKMGLTTLFIAHDLAVVKYFSHRIAVMYYGKIVELATSDELFAHPLHPYTKALLSAIPIPDANRKRNRIILEGDVPNLHSMTFMVQKEVGLRMTATPGGKDYGALSVTVGFFAARVSSGFSMNIRRRIFSKNTNPISR